MNATHAAPKWWTLHHAFSYFARLVNTDYYCRSWGRVKQELQFKQFWEWNGLFVTEILFILHLTSCPQTWSNQRINLCTVFHRWNVQLLLKWTFNAFHLCHIKHVCRTLITEHFCCSYHAIFRVQKQGEKCGRTILMTSSQVLRKFTRKLLRLVYDKRKSWIFWILNLNREFEEYAQEVEMKTRVAQESPRKKSLVPLNEEQKANSLCLKKVTSCSLVSSRISASRK
jgi:hypothetical protein